MTPLISLLFTRIYGQELKEDLQREGLVIKLGTNLSLDQLLSETRDKSRWKLKNIEDKKQLQ